MRKSMIFFLAILIPTTIFALDFSGTNLPYNDVPEGTPEAAGISVLTREGALRGYADGAFRPKNLLNRAEFLKIVLESRYVLFSDSYTVPELPCFPDVPKDAWYSAYVCFAKQEGMTSGFPIDWKFHPERSVTYAEALKMLSTLYRYSPTYEDGDQWYSSFLRSATTKGVTLPIGTELGAPLTRGQMARLTAAYLSESKGLLDAYRKSERGEYVVIGSSSSSLSFSEISSSSSSSVTSSSASSSSSISSKKSFYTLPTQSHFLLVGSTSDALASGTLFPEEESEITGIEVRLINEASSIEFFEITTESGVVIATLPRRTTADRSDFRKIYEIAIESGKGYRVMPSASGTNIMMRARVRSLENSGVADQYVEIISWNITMQNKVSNVTKTVNVPTPFPSHQTAFGRILPVQTLSASTGSLSSGTGVILGRFTFSGSRLQGRSLTLENLLFTVEKTVGVHIGNLRLRSMVWPYLEHVCTLNITVLSCTNLPSGMNDIVYGKGLTLELIGDIETTAMKTKNTLKVFLCVPGGPSELGSVQWTDGSGHYRWIEGISPLASGTSWIE